ncbi:MAG: aldo/keto reductase [Clostridia bacterium]|nr:aldo/keto reductase [Clostridia bacterium]
MVINLFKSLSDCYVLSNGVKIPCIGFGTWQAPDGDVAAAAVKAAIQAGYRHIDTAAAYQNEESVGRAIKECGVPREELFITTKLNNPVRGYDNTIQAFNESMEKLGLDVLDLYLVHWPAPKWTRETWLDALCESWRAMEDLYKAGRIRSIGVSNFWPHHLDPMLSRVEIAPMVNQIHLCPGDHLEPVIRYTQYKNILIQAYSPLGHGEIFKNEQMQALAAKYGRSIAQLCIRWSLQLGYLPLPKSVTAARIEENGRVFDFEISAEDMAVISSLTGCCDTAHDPDNTAF